jgi:pSer/pThr/pTyr-binding forkhead associated (FHA) protein
MLNTYEAGPAEVQKFRDKMCDMWILQGSGQDQDLLIFRVKEGGIKTVGRAPRADFIVDRALVSRLHCRLEAGDGGLEVIDLSSTNGTYVNGERIERARLTTGDCLRVGRVELTVEQSE